MSSTLIQRSFAGGELAPGLAARADLAKYVSAARTVRNFIVRRHGGVSNRSGTKFCAATKTGGSSPSFLYPFIFAASSKSYMIEAGDLYFRFFKADGTPVTVSGVAAYSGATAYVPGDLVVQSGVNYYCKAATTGNAPPNATYWYPLTGNLYEIPSPYVSGRFQAPAPACLEQNGLVITITHLDEPPRELAFSSETRWVLSPITTASWAAAPVGLGGTAGAVGAGTYKYVVTAVKATTYEETGPSSVRTIVSAAAPTPDAPNVVTWTAVSGSVEYYVYSDAGTGNGTYGFIGTATGQNQFQDVGFIADFSRTPPIPRTLFASTNNYPAVTTVYQQRRIAAGTHTDRETIYGSQIGFRANFQIRSPLQDDDAITFSLAGKHIQPVLHMLALEVGLVVLTDAGAFVLPGDETGTLTPTAFNPKQHSWVGASFTEPVVVGESVLFVQARGRVLRDLRFDQQIEGLSGRDLSLYAAHLFPAGKTITDLCYAMTPDSVVYGVRSDGVLVGLTYIRDEDVWGWHRHDTDGTFEQVCTIPDGDTDAVFVIVKRSVNGSDVRYVERFAAREFTDIKDAFFVDAGITYNGAATTAITGLSHLRGKTVKVLADGVVPAGTFVVTSAGAITLPTAAAKVQVGLPITAQLETLDLDVQGSSIRDARKSVKAIALLLEDSSRGFLVGPDSDHLLPLVKQEWESDGLVSGQVQMNLTTGFTDSGRTLIQQTDPLPLTVLGVLPHVELGG